jgi:DNA-binding MarR family transcriptional regulator
MRGSVSDADYRALADFRYQIRRYLNFSEQASRGAGLEPQQYLLLLTVRGLPDGAEATIRTLASRLLIRHHSAVELVDRLEKRGMVRRAQSKTDRRQVLVRLTPRGESALARLARQRLVELRSTGMALVRALDALIGTTRRGES